MSAASTPPAVAPVAPVRPVVRSLRWLWWLGGSGGSGRSGVRPVRRPGRPMCRPGAPAAGRCALSTIYAPESRSEGLVADRVVVTTAHCGAPRRLV